MAAIKLLCTSGQSAGCSSQGSLPGNGDLMPGFYAVETAAARWTGAGTPCGETGSPECRAGAHAPRLQVQGDGTDTADIMRTSAPWTGSAFSPPSPAP